ncbi:MAG: MaoC family dehydratase N-terminal domain-containing protein [Chloroflexi bacterium]|nr:MaoC family dehydratase N-terminal domain-containing protein [Chloroflexota bacterium]
MAKKYFEDVEIGSAWESPARTITEQDIRTFAELVGNIDPLHFDREYAKQTRFGDIIAPGPLTFAVSAAISAYNRNTHDLGLLEIERLRFSKPVYPGDTISVRCEVVDKRATSKGEWGMVKSRYSVQKADGSVVAEYLHAYMVRCRPQAR